MKNTTIAAISTAQGVGGIGVIRISGDDALLVADRIFKSISKKKISDMKGYTATFGHVYLNSEPIDEAVTTVFLAPHSYTGENVVEISCHGGLFVTRQVLRAALENGAVIAGPGEFTKRAFLNGKMDLAEAESVMDIISAKNRLSARTALSVKEGALSKKIDAVTQTLLDATAHLAAWADYPEEDIENVTNDGLLSSIESCIEPLQKLYDNYDVGHTVKEGIDTVIAGKPNVGKSTLMNLLSGAEKSIVTDIPGTTRDIVEETVVLGDIVLNLSDTAGIRSTDNVIEQIGVDKAKSRLKSCGLVLAVFDNSAALTDEDKELIDFLSDAPCVAVINKTDLPQKLEVDFITDRIKNVVMLSAKNGEGIALLTKAVTEIAGTTDFDPSTGVLINERQRAAVKNALSSLDDAKNALTLNMTLDAVTVSLEEAAAYLLELSGKKVSEEVVNKVFHNFCVGK